MYMWKNKMFIIKQGYRYLPFVEEEGGWGQ